MKLFVYSRSFPEQRGEYALKAVGALVTTVVAFVFLFLFDPAKSWFYCPCLFRSLTGLYCPGCGSLRGLHQLLHGNFSAAFGLNPLMVLSLPFLAYSFISYSMFIVRGRALPSVFLRPVWIWLLLGIILAFWILRNIPF